MLTALRVRDLGPLQEAAYALDPSGEVTIQGPSQSGKSSAMEALCLLLWGTDSTGAAFPVDLIRDGAKRCEVEADTARGYVLRATLTRTGSWTRTKTAPDGTETRYASATAWREALGPIARQVAADKRVLDVGRLLLSPLGWLELAGGPGGGRALRDLIVSLLPGDDAEEVRRILGDDARDGDPTTLKDAEKRRTDANRMQAQEEGALREAQATLARAEQDAPEVVDEEDVLLAHQTLAVAEEWEAHDRAIAVRAARVDAAARAQRQAEDWDRRAAGLTATAPAQDAVQEADRILDAGEEWDRYDGATAQYAQRIGDLQEAHRRQVQAWDQRLAELGTRPAAPDPGEVEKAEADALTAGRAAVDADKAVLAAIDERSAAEMALIKARARRAQAEAEAESARGRTALLDGVPCKGGTVRVPTGKRTVQRGQLSFGDELAPVDTSSCRFLADARQAAAEVPTLEANARQAAEVVTAAEARHAAALAALTATTDAAEHARSDSGRFNRNRDQLRRQVEAVARWDGQRKALGDPPAEPALTAAPGTPGGTRPTEQALEQARLVIAGATAARNVVRERAALGSRPVVEVVEDLPAAPDGTRPTVAEVEEARRTIRQGERGAGEAQAHARALVATQGAVRAHEAALATARADAAHFNRLVEALRAAPSARLRRGMDALGDLGPVPIEPDGEGVRVLVDGRAWRTASKGRRILADLHVRMALRRAAGLPSLPLWVEESQSWSGEWPESAPVVYLVTVKQAEKTEEAA